MTSEKKFAANRLNALKSTGPVTPEGKAAVRFNALRHGLYASQAVLPGENRAQFEELCDTVEADWDPQTATEKILAERLAVCYWSQLRVARTCQKLFQQDKPVAEQLHLQDRLDQHDARLQRSFHRALNALRSLQKDRQKPVAKAKPEDDDDGCGKDWSPGLKWLRNDGTEDIAALPALRGEDGLWHEVSFEDLDKYLDQRDQT